MGDDCKLIGEVNRAARMEMAVQVIGEECGFA